MLLVWVCRTSIYKQDLLLMLLLPLALKYVLSHIAQGCTYAFGKAGFHLHNKTPCTNSTWQGQNNSETICIPPHWQSTNTGHTGAFPSKRCNAAVQVAMYYDLHGHSRKHGTFMYGCEQASSPQVSHTSCLLHCMHFSAPPLVAYRS